MTAVSTACKRDFSSMPAMKKQALSSASGRSVLVRMQIAGFGECAAVAYDSECVHLQAVVVVESERFVLNHALVELEARGGKTVTTARVAAVQNRHVVLFGHLVDGGKEARKVLLGINILFAVGAEQNVLALFEAEAGVNVTRFNLREVLVQNFGHGAAGHVRAFLGQAAVSEVAASVFGVGHVHIADDVHDAAVRLFGEAFVLAAVAGFHMENRDVQALCGNGRKAAVGVTKNQQCIRFASDHKLVAAIDDVTHSCAEVITHGIHIDFGILEAQVLEKHAIQVVIVVLTRVRKNAVKVLAALVDDCRKADDFRARAHDNQKFQFAVIGEFHVAIICFNIHKFSLDPSTSLRMTIKKSFFLQAHFGRLSELIKVPELVEGPRRSYFTTFSPKVSGWFGSNCSFAHMTVTRFSVCERLMMLCV